MATFSKQEIEEQLKPFEGLEDKNRFILRTHRVSADQFEMACYSTENPAYWVLIKGDGADPEKPYWNQVGEGDMPDWWNNWNNNAFGNEDFCQEDIDAAADYISS